MSSMTGRFCIAAAFSATLAIAQTPTAPSTSTPTAQTTPPAFDVVSIKPSRPREMGHAMVGSTGYSAAAVPLIW